VDKYILPKATILPQQAIFSKPTAAFFIPPNHYLESTSSILVGRNHILEPAS
jgi:hypothetical protein